MVKETVFDEVHDAQSQFRVLLDAMARPGKIYQFSDITINPPSGINKASAIIALSLLNSDSSFTIAEREHREEIKKWVALNSNAEIVTIDHADFVFFTGHGKSSVLQYTKKGSLTYPENSASIIIDVLEISVQELVNAVGLKLNGPGVETTVTAYIKGIDPAILEIVKEQNAEFPMGIDLMLTDQKNAVLCIPRSNRFEIL